jgi:Mn2+/Fe2+ NRAMP family transporter
MISIQMLSARIGWVTGRGLAANINQLFPRWVTVGLVTLFVIANTINIAADIGAMGEAVRLFTRVPVGVSVIGFGLACIAAPVFFLMSAP